MTAALAKARAAGDEFLVAAATGALGSLAFMSRRTAVAEPLLLDSQAGARRLGDDALAGAGANDLGNLYAATKRPDPAAPPTPNRHDGPRRPATACWPQLPRPTPRGLPSAATTWRRP